MESSLEQRGVESVTVAVLPSAVRRILVSSAAAAGLAAPVLVGWAGWKVGVVFLVAAGWALANLILWSVFIQVGLRPKEQRQPGHGLAMAFLGLMKVVLIAGGMVALVRTGGLPMGQSFGLIGGLTLPMVIAALLVIGASLTGRDFDTGQPETKRLRVTGRESVTTATGGQHS